MQDKNKKIAIVQSSYIPWRGYFGLISAVDEFVLFDDMQFTKRDWRSRNKIKTANGSVWLTVPVQVRGKYHQRIMDTLVSDVKWRKKHWNSVKMNYAKSPFFKDYGSIFENLYLGSEEKKLSTINYKFIIEICKILDIDTKISWSTDYETSEDRSERLASIAEQANGSVYISGPAAKEYMDLSCFENKGIEVQWADYSNLKEYPQLYGEFESQVSVLDLIFNCGKDARKYISIDAI